MARQPLPLGIWGRIRTYPVHYGKNGKPDKFRARTKFRDFDGKTREVEAVGKTKTEAENNLRNSLKARSTTGHGGDLTAMHRFKVVADLWLKLFEEAVNDGTRSPTSLDTYRRHLTNHILPALAEVRLGEATTPRLDKVVTTIKKNAGASTARSCRSVISGAMGLAVRYGAITANPVRDITRIESPGKRPARALTDEERTGWFEQLASDPRAVRKDLPDLTNFMLGTGARIGETLAVLWEQIKFDTREVELTHTIVRIKGEGLIRKKTKSDAGERLLGLPSWTLAMLQTRFAAGVRLDQPVFTDDLGGFRDPANVRRDLRDARSPVGSQARQALAKHLRTVRRATGRTQTEVAQSLGWPKTRISLIETGRVKLDIDDAAQLLDLYGLTGTERDEALELVQQALDSPTDAFAWITSHVFRKTVATILDDAGQSGRQVADQLGHSRASMTQDHYIGRKVRNPAAAAAAALEDAGPSL